MEFIVGNFEVYLNSGYQGKIRFKFNESSKSDWLKFRLNPEDIADLQYTVEKIKRLDANERRP